MFACFWRRLELVFIEYPFFIHQDSTIIMYIFDDLVFWHCPKFGFSLDLLAYSAARVMSFDFLESFCYHHFCSTILMYYQEHIWTSLPLLPLFQSNVHPSLAECSPYKLDFFVKKKTLQISIVAVLSPFTNKASVYLPSVHF